MSPSLAASPSSAAPFESLHSLLFVKGRRFSLLEAVSIAEQLLEVAEYMALDAQPVPADVARAWFTFSPARIMISQTAASSSSSSSSFGPIRVLFCPGFFVHDGPVNRYTAPPSVAAPIAFSLCLLLVTVLTATPPHRGAASQAALLAAQRSGGGGGPRGHEPFDLSRSHLPPEFRQTIDKAIGRMASSRELWRELHALKVVAARFPPSLNVMYVPVQGAELDPSLMDEY